MRNLLIRQIPDQPVDPAEPADPLRKRLPDGTLDAACKGDNAVDPRFGDAPRERGRFGRSGQNEEARAHV